MTSGPKFETEDNQSLMGEPQFPCFVSLLNHASSHFKRLSIILRRPGIELSGSKIDMQFNKIVERIGVNLSEPSNDLLLLEARLHVSHPVDKPLLHERLAELRVKEGIQSATEVQLQSILFFCAKFPDKVPFGTFQQDVRIELEARDDSRKQCKSPWQIKAQAIKTQKASMPQPDELGLSQLKPNPPVDHPGAASPNEKIPLLPDSLAKASDAAKEAPKSREKQKVVTPTDSLLQTGSASHGKTAENQQ